ncbi:UNVERIFIED_CONTAM: EamA-like transporter family protein [Murimonas intestini]|uniref:EamA-like transporter family protein n=2 Tax=Murimonas intestini TaxID=1337051 RepID=A0AB73T8V5_9FIRM|nr:EamA family transporter [Murimonas intestini]MCR1839432.1 EamA family transporter [Murimonas intestini]MCR1864727.1 EamA family transporter [Murimonas intestini]
MNNMTYSVILLLVSVFISAVSQILLKKATYRHYDTKLREYLNPYVIIAYGMFFVSTILTMLALKTVPLSMQPMLESTSYIYVSVMGYFLLKERFSKRKILGICVILLGIFVYSV